MISITERDHLNTRVGWILAKTMPEAIDRARDAGREDIAALLAKPIWGGGASSCFLTKPVRGVGVSRLTRSRLEIIIGRKGR